MILLICGGRDFTDTYAFDEAMKILPFNADVIVSGGARGADTLARNWSLSKGIPFVEIPALWNYHGKAAGSKRNQSMIDIMKPNYCIAFKGGNGTKDMVDRCKNNAIPVWIPY